MISAEQHFVAMYDDFLDILDNPTDYNLINAAGKLRLLLLDGNSLLHEARRNHDYQPVFFVPEDAGQGFDFEREAIWHSASIAAVPKSNKKPQNLERFLKATVAKAAERQVTIREVIDYVANVGGGVHRGNINGKKKRADVRLALHTVSGKFTINGILVPLEVVSDILLVVTEGLKPLYNKLRC